MRITPQSFGRYDYFDSERTFGFGSSFGATAATCPTPSVYVAGRGCCLKPAQTGKKADQCCATKKVCDASIVTHKTRTGTTYSFNCKAKCDTTPQPGNGGGGGGGGGSTPANGGSGGGTAVPTTDTTGGTDWTSTITDLLSNPLVWIGGIAILLISSHKKKPAATSGGSGSTTMVTT